MTKFFKEKTFEIELVTNPDYAEEKRNYSCDPDDMCKPGNDYCRPYYGPMMPTLTLSNS